MKPTIHHPLDGAPRTIETRDKDGKPVFYIKARALTPFRAKVADWMIAAASFAVVSVCAVEFMTAPSWLFLAVMVALGFACIGLLRLVIRFTLARTTRLRLGLDEVAVRRLLFWRRYDRNVPHVFRLQQHDATADEELKVNYEIEIARQERKVIKPTFYYARSAHVVFDYAGQRIDLLSVYGPKDANAIVARLQFVDALLDRAQGRSGGYRSDPVRS